ncbi:Uncharacterized conserved protein, DUF1330 family [Rhodospirillales bacterium URHD0017]|nr:Uncharacterized conserved protein, DUF1330 family [Rhodospirillales bacterium URHD0017]
MKTRFVVLVSMMVGVALGAAAVQALHAQARPPAFVVGEIDVKDAAMLDKEYVPNASKVVRDGGGKYLVAGGKSVSFYGEPPRRIAIMAFENLEKAEAAFNSAAYKQAKAVGDKYATFRIYAVEGVTP